MNVPKLRFKDDNGQDFPEWEEKTLGEIVIFLDAKRIPLSESERNNKQGQYPYYGASGIIDYIDEYIFDGEFVLLGEDGANILTRNSKLAFVINGKFWVNNHAHIMQATGSNIFLAESLERIQYEQYNSGTVQPKLNIESCKRIILNIPSLPEQTKIANFLTAVDDKIAELTKKVELLQRYKKGAMQQIFSQQLRFKDDNGQDFPEWVEEILKNVCIINPKSPKLPNKFIYIDLESVKNGLLLVENQVELELAPSRAQRLLQKNDILYQMVRPYQRNNLIFQKEGNYVASTGYAQLRTNQNAHYLFHFLHTDHFVDAVMLCCTGTSYPAIDTTSLSKMVVCLPSLPEQTKIANFLSALDEQINTSQQQLDSSKKYKQSLLQQMFI